MGSYQNEGPILAPLNIRCRNIIYNQKGANNFESNPSATHANLLRFQRPPNRREKAACAEKLNCSIHISLRAFHRTKLSWPSSQAGYGFPPARQHHCWCSQLDFLYMRNIRLSVTMTQQSAGAEALPFDALRPSFRPERYKDLRQHLLHLAATKPICREEIFLGASGATERPWQASSVRQRRLLLFLHFTYYITSSSTIITTCH